MIKESSARKNEVICSDCGQYESECKCLISPTPVVEDLREKIASEIDKAIMADIVDGRVGVLPYADSILTLLKEAGWVKLDKDQTLPDIPSFGYDKEDDIPLLKRGAINYVEENSMAELSKCCGADIQWIGFDDLQYRAYCVKCEAECVEMAKKPASQPDRLLKDEIAEVLASEYGFAPIAAVEKIFSLIKLQRWDVREGQLFDNLE